MILVLSGKSCSGKTTIRNEFVKKGYKPIITYTTRPIRNGEVDGVDYHFISDEEFLSKIEEGFFAEYKAYYTNQGTWYYGSSKESFEEDIDKDKIIILTPAGLDDIKSSSICVPIFSVYIYSNMRTIQDRLKARGDDPIELVRRMQKDNEDFLGMERKADKIVYNNKDTELKDVINKIEEYIKVYKSI